MARLGEQLGPEHLPETIPADAHPVMRHILERQQAGSVRGERDDERVIALTVEGGGHRGTISAGMLIGFDAMGLMPAVDIIYGVSSGGLNATYAAAGQAALGATNYEDTANHHFAGGLNLLKSGTMVNFDVLFEEAMAGRKPHDEDKLSAGPEFRAVAVDPERSSVEILKDFDSVDQMVLALRASCAIPVFSRPFRYGGRMLSDGGLMAPLAHREALEDGATDVLALRTQPAGYRRPIRVPTPIMEIIYRRRLSKDIAHLVAEHAPIYNAAADDIEELSAEPGPVFQIAPHEEIHHIARAERSITKVRAGLVAGTTAVAAAFGAPEVDLHWQPVPYVIRD
jgi:predicted patatin/cPLA2 family phospholipase